MKTLQCNGLFFNSKKCTIWQPQITFYGAVFTQHSMKLDSANVQALQDFPTCVNQKDLQSFLGLHNYLEPFTPDLSNKTSFLRAQIPKWDSKPSTDADFQQLKAWMCNWLLHTTLTYYYREKPITIQTNASEYGLGAALPQDGHPSPFASKTLTDTETRYANTKRECLSFCFRFKKFNSFIYERHITRTTMTPPNDRTQVYIWSSTFNTKNASLNAEIWLHDSI